MAEVTNFKCPNCGAPLAFSPEDGEVKCDYCDSTFQASVLEKLYRDAQAPQGTTDTSIDWGAHAPGGSWEAGEEESLQVYTCPSCGAAIICDENTIATTCVYCGNPTVLEGRLAGTLRPDYIIPFKKTKEEAVAALKKFYRGKRLLPGIFARNNHIEEIRGIYVPFWLFDSDIQADFVYDAVRSHMAIVGDNEITTIEHYRAARSGTMAFDKIPADGSTKMEDRYMDAIEPFNYDELEPFTRAYLPGFLAEKYDVDAEESIARVSERINKSVALAMSTTLPYDQYTPTHQHVALTDKSARYALLPVWMLTTQWQGKTYTFAMNGQTGRMVGDLPISKGRTAGWFCGITAGTFALLSALALLLF